jgi:hypothetical protein
MAKPDEQPLRFTLDAARWGSSAAGNIPAWGLWFWL